ncbi:hypothetical protein AC249_AIPGENE19560 [Exaiptasia diaphana]|nr:hypothetical protein AC249_AIPGENE19560 [Exaiptasia diaphana]
MDQGALYEKIHQLDKSRSGYFAAITKLCNYVDKLSDTNNNDLLRQLESRLREAFNSAVKSQISKLEFEIQQSECELQNTIMSANHYVSETVGKASSCEPMTRTTSQHESNSGAPERSTITKEKW